MIKRSLKLTVPWLITAVSLYFAFRGLNWGTLFSHIGDARPLWIAVAIGLTVTSYLLRSARWQMLFPTHSLRFADAAKVLFFGFFMNNVLPARMGELTRAHLGARLSKQSGMLVLATIASERLIDGLTLSLFFVIFAFHAGDGALSRNFFYVACGFAAVAVGVLVSLIFRNRIFSLAEKFHLRFDTKTSHYAFTRLQVFINGLAPVFHRSTVLPLAIWSAVIWSVELAVYYAVSAAYGAPLPWNYCVLFLVAVNFSSLIPAAPGGIGVIEAVGRQVLQSIGVPGELALVMVLTQHAIQYVVVGIPGAYVTLTWRQLIRESEIEAETSSASAQPAGL